MNGADIVYQCVRCHIIWSNNQDLQRLSDKDIVAGVLDGSIAVSSGLCPICLRGETGSKIRAEQRRSGYDDCFLSATNGCDYKNCIYRSLCLDTLISEWKASVITQINLANQLQNSVPQFN